VNELPEVTVYVDDILTGKIASGRLVKLACERYIADLKRTDINFDAMAAKRVIDFFPKYFHHTTGEWRGQPFVLQPWQQFCVANLFGFKNKSGFRRYRNSYLEIGRKNGKTALAAGIALYMLIGDGEARAECYSSATKLDQAKICFMEARRMVRSSMDLKKHIRVLRASLSVESNDSTFSPLGSDHSNLDGLNIHCSIVDEVHAHKSRDLYDVLQTATGARQQSIIFCITTAGSNPDPETSIAFQLREFGVSVLEGHAQDDTSFYYIAAMDPKDDWRNEENWIKSNPSLGVTVGVEALRNEAKKVKNLVSAQNAFKRYRMNMWVETEKVWITSEDWDACNLGPIDLGQLEGKRAYVGADLAKRGDTSSIILYFPVQEGLEHNTVLSFIFLPHERLLQKQQAEKTPWKRWERNQKIFTCPGAYIRAEFLADWIETLDGRYQLQDFVYDKAYMSDLLPKLEDMGWTSDPKDEYAPRHLIEIPQTFLGMHPCIQVLEEQIANRGINHGGHPVLSWMCRQVVIIENDQSLARFSKRKSKSKIDGIVALSMVTFAAKIREAEPETDEPEIWFA
jgi:phage terminase large subunit-like protein